MFLATFFQWSPIGKSIFEEHVQCCLISFPQTTLQKFCGLKHVFFFFFKFSAVRFDVVQLKNLSCSTKSTIFWGPQLPTSTPQVLRALKEKAPSLPLMAVVFLCGIIMAKGLKLEEVPHFFQPKMSIKKNWWLKDVATGWVKLGGQVKSTKLLYC